MLHLCGTYHVLERRGVRTSDLPVSGDVSTSSSGELTRSEACLLTTCVQCLRHSLAHLLQVWSLFNAMRPRLTRIRNFSCTFCKTSLPSLLFSRSPSNPLPTEHHITPSPPNRIAAALANADKLEKGERRDKGLTLPGLLDLGQFPFNDEKLGVVFEDEDMVSFFPLSLSSAWDDHRMRD